MSVKFSINNKFHALSLVILLLGVFAVSFNYFILSPVGKSFEEYKSQVAQRAHLMMNMRAAFGYGGSIHNFKNFVLRGSPKYTDRVQKNTEELLLNIREYRSLANLSSQETQALAAIESVAKQYASNAKRITPMLKEGKTPREIDSVVKIDDTPAISAFQTLDKNFNLQTEQFTALMNRSIASALSMSLWSILAGVILTIVLVQIMRSTVINPLNKAVDAMADISRGEGDLSVRLQSSRHTELDDLTQNFNQFIAKIGTLIGEVVGSAGKMEQSAKRVAELAETTTQDVANQQSDIELTVTSVTELATSAEEVAQSSAESAQASRSVSESSSAGQDSIEHTIASVSSLSDEVNRGADVIRSLAEESQNIGTVLDVIQGIAEQTNLLALNAAIEAARAGDQGRGFAVVADEVRALAQRTHDSTEEIQQIVHRLQGQSEAAVSAMESGQNQAQSGVEMVKDAGDTLRSIASSMVDISSRGEQIAISAQQQSSTCEALNQSVAQIMDVSRNSTDVARQTHEVAEDIVHMGEDLHRLGSQFKLNAG